MAPPLIRYRRKDWLRGKDAILIPGVNDVTPVVTFFGYVLLACKTEAAARAVRYVLGEPLTEWSPDQE